MREQLEILMYQFKKRNNLDVYSELNIDELWQFILEVQEEIKVLNQIHKVRNEVK